jgi:uncharacterized membrane protein YphA (DoxX/SURF4 family)
LSKESHQAFLILRFGFTVAPIIAGLDKFLGLLTNWDKYLAPAVSNSLGIAPHTFMVAVGVIEIVAGLVVATRPRFGGYLVAAWLVGIIINLVLTGGYLDVALRDLGLCLGAISLARLAEAEERVGVTARA